MPKVLKNLKVTEVSILTGDKLPANGESVIIKDDSSMEIVAKADKCIDGLVYCTVMKANTPDTDGEEADPATIQKAAHDFLKNSRSIDENHDHATLEGVSVVQSYIADNGDWKAVFDVSENAVMLEKAKKGEIKGVSIYGRAEKVEKAGKEISSKNASKLKQAWDILSSFFKDDEQQTAKVEKGFVSTMAINDMWRITNTLESTLRKTLEDESVTDKEAQLKKDIAEFQAYLLKNIPTATELQKNKQEEPLMTKDELKAMLAEIKAEEKSSADSAAREQEFETLKATVKSQGETIEKQAKTIEDLAKNRKTDSETGDGEITLEMIQKCADPVKQQEMYETYRKNR